MRNMPVSLFLAVSLGVAVSFVAVTSCAEGTHARAEAHRGHRISMAEARKTALHRVPGKLKAQELEHEDGRWIYSFEIRPKGETRKIIREVNVDADSGRIVDVSTERD